MGKKRSSILGNIGWGLAGDILLFAAVILIMSLFAISSISTAYLIAFAVLIVAAVSSVLYKKSRAKSSS